MSNMTIAEAKGLSAGTHRRNPATGQVEKVGTAVGFGLVERVVTDSYSGARRREFTQADPTAPKLWMREYMKPRFLQLVVGKDRAWNERIAAESLADLESRGLLTSDGQVRSCL